MAVRKLDDQAERIVDIKGFCADAHTVNVRDHVLSQKEAAISVPFVQGGKGCSGEFGVVAGNGLVRSPVAFEDFRNQAAADFACSRERGRLSLLCMREGAR